jgi:hypothetical protein
MSDHLRRPSVPRTIVRFVVLALVWLVALGCAVWAFGALHYDFPIAGKVVAWVFALGLVAGVVLIGGRWRKPLVVFAGFVVVLAWWLMLKPSSDRGWQPDVAQTAWAEIDGDVVTLHNIRNFDYRTATDYTPRWETRTVRLSKLTGIDIAITYWGSPWMAHPIVSFQFADAPPVCFSIETRKEVGEGYSTIGGFYRRFELIYIVADERDVIRLRTNFRDGEDVYLYRLSATREKARERFLEYITVLNELHARPRWYNAATGNCTTSIRTQHAASERAPWDWRMLVNGKGDEMLFERGALAADGLGFAELRRQALINPAALSAGGDPDFSRRIREGRAGFASDGR